MKIVDAFLFNNEIELLDARLRHLENQVDMFTIVEHGRTFAGEEKPLVLQENWDRFSWINDRIRLISVPADKSPTNSNRWQNETSQRQMLDVLLEDVASDDLVLLGDLDEFPSHHALKVAETAPWSTCMQCGHFYYTDWRIPGLLWMGTQIHRGKLPFNAQAFREHRGSGVQITPGGWHFTYCGGVDRIIQKVKGFSHSEFDTPEINNHENISQAIRDRRVFLDGLPLEQAPLSDLPAAIVECRSVFPGLFAPEAI